jgi:Leucine-rich repeat (LRR) protein
MFRIRSLQVLDVSMNQMSGTIPSEICLSKQLSTFSMAFNPLLTGTIPTKFGQLLPLTLKLLYMNNCSITGILPTQLGNLVALTDFDVSGTQLSGTIPSEFGQLLQLTSLRAFATSVTGSIPKSVCQAFSQKNANTGIVVNCTQVKCDCNCSCYPIL